MDNKMEKMRELLDRFFIENSSEYIEKKINDISKINVEGETFESYLENLNLQLVYNKKRKGLDSRKKFWLSIRKAENCLFSRREGIQGKIILGYSVRLRLFNRDII